MLVIEAAQALLAQGRPGTVPHQPLQAVAVPGGDGHRGVHGPAAGVVRCVEYMHGGAVQVAVAMQPAQAALADLPLHRLEVGRVQLGGRMELGTIVAATAEHAVGHENMEVHVAVEVAAEPVDERDGAEACVGRSAGTPLTDRGLHRSQEHAEHAAGHLKRYLPLMRRVEHDGQISALQRTLSANLPWRPTMVPWELAQ